MDEHKKELNRIRVARHRALKKTLIGDEAYRESVKLSQQKYRLNVKQKNDIALVNDGLPIAEPRKQETIEEIKTYVSNLVVNLLDDSENKKVFNLPVVKLIAEQKIKKFDLKKGAVTSCKKLIEVLDTTNLVNGKYERISEISKVDYINNMKLVYKAVTGKVFDCTDVEFDIFRDVANITKTINNMKVKPATKTKRFTSILSILERIDGFEDEVKQYRVLQNSNQKLVDTERKKNVLTLRESNNWMNWNDIKNYNDPTWNDESKFLHSLYTSIPPRRLDYGLLKLARRKSVPEAQKMDKKFNYIVTNKNDIPISLVINRYKTDKHYYTQIVDLTQKDSTFFKFSNIVKLGKKFILHGADDGSHIIHNDPLFPNRNGELYSNFGERLVQLFSKTKKRISCDILRHSFITNWLSTHDISKTSTDTLDKLATSMSHSTSMFLTYRKIDAEQALVHFNGLEEEFKQEEEEKQ